MGTVHYPAAVKLFCALLVAPTFSLSDLEAALEQTWGPIVLRSTPTSFTQTTYYKSEMGEGLTRFYVAFDPLIHSAELMLAKHTAHCLEAAWCTPHGQRRVNVDPGLLLILPKSSWQPPKTIHTAYTLALVFLPKSPYGTSKRVFNLGSGRILTIVYPKPSIFFNRLRALYYRQLRQTA